MISNEKIATFFTEISKGWGRFTSGRRVPIALWRTTSMPGYATYSTRGNSPKGREHRGIVYTHVALTNMSDMTYEAVQKHRWPSWETGGIKRNKRRLIYARSMHESSLRQPRNSKILCIIRYNHLQ